MKKSPRSFDKYFYYRESVQSPEEDVRFFARIYKSFNGRGPQILREDFCGTFSISVAWVKSEKSRRAVAIDADSAPLSYGRDQYLSRLNPSQKNRLTVIQNDVLHLSLPPADIISVSNFSYYVFKERGKLLEYFKSARRKLKKSGLFIIDAFGGSETEGPNEESVKCDGWTYYWDQADFDPVTNRARFHIHFKRGGEKKRMRQFTYDWRLWSLPELKDILADAGFSQTHIYWEKADKKGEGTGAFRKAVRGEPCDAYVAYLISLR